MLYEYILPVYIYKKYGFFASYEQIIGLEEIGDITESGNYLYISSLNAWNIKSDLAKIYKDFPWKRVDLSLFEGIEEIPVSRLFKF